MEQALNKLDYWLFPSKVVTESQDRARFIRGGDDPLKTLDVGHGHIYGPHYKLFMEVYNMAINSENFEYVSEIVWDPKDSEAPYFNIESKFHNWNPVSKESIPEQFVIFLYPIYLACYMVSSGNEVSVKTKESFDEITRCFDEG